MENTIVSTTTQQPKGEKLRVSPLNFYTVHRIKLTVERKPSTSLRVHVFPLVSSASANPWMMVSTSSSDSPNARCTDSCDRWEAMENSFLVDILGQFQRQYETRSNSILLWYGSPLVSECEGGLLLLVRDSTSGRERRKVDNNGVDEEDSDLYDDVFRTNHIALSEMTNRITPTTSTHFFSRFHFF